MSVNKKDYDDISPAQPKYNSDNDEIQNPSNETSNLIHKDNTNYGALNQSEKNEDDDSSYRKGQGSCSSSYFSKRHIPEEEMQKQRTSGRFHTINNITKLYIGFAIMSFPHTFTDSGFIGTMIALVIGLLINMFSVYLLVKARNYYKDENLVNLAELVERTHGRKCKIFTQAVIVVTQALFIMIYFIYLGEQASLLTEGTSEKRKIFAFYFTIILMPIIAIKMLKDVSIFSLFANLVSIATVLILFGLQISAYLNQDEIDWSSYSVPEGTYTEEELNNQFEYIWYGAWLMPVTISYTMTIFEGNAALLNYYSQFQDPKEFLYLLWGIMIFVTVMAGMLGITGYMAYGNLTNDSVLYNLQSNTSLSKTLQVLYMIVISGSLVVQFQPIAQLCESSETYQKYEKWPRICRIFTRFILIQIIFGISASFPDISTAADLTGAILAPVVSIIIPSICYMKIYRSREGQEPNKREWLNKYIWAFIVLGCTIGFIGFTTVVYRLIKNEE